VLALPHTPLMQPLVDTKVLRPAESAIALKLISEMDFLRLKSVARLHARGLPPDVGWDDLLQEAFTRVIAGSRLMPDGVSMIAFLAGIMRSLKSEHWRRALTGPASLKSLRLDQASDERTPIELHDPAPSPERLLVARQELIAIERLFADDRLALQIIAGLRDGLSAQQIRTSKRISKIDYDSTRRRMRRTFIRAGLTCEQG
jgi:DNA-directed RNA polymerase specialized sigma24 family protein